MTLMYGISIHQVTSQEWMKYAF